jgi:hypothetical protein
MDKNIKLVATTGAKLNTLIHETAMMIANHAKEHGDCTRALMLAKAMPASMRRTMLVLWFHTYTPIRVMLQNDKVGISKEGTKLFIPWNLEEGQQTPFFELAEQNPEQPPMDIEKILGLIAGLSKRIEKKIEAGEVLPDAVEGAKSVTRALAAIKVEKGKPANNADDEDNVALKAVA